MSPGVIYHRPTSIYPTLFGTTTPYKILVYTPPATARAGVLVAAPRTRPPTPIPTSTRTTSCRSSRATPASRPAARPRIRPGVDGATREVVKTTDPLTPSNVGYVVPVPQRHADRWRRGDHRRELQFSLDSGDYRATYKMGTASLAPNNTWGFNPEHSTVVTPSYRETLGDRWLNNGLAITDGRLDRRRHPRPHATTTRPVGAAATRTRSTAARTTPARARSS